MSFPVSEKTLPAFKHLAFALALLATPLPAAADAAADYDEGLAAYRKGDVTGAMAPLKRAADADNARAQALYGTILDSAELDEEAADYLRKAADQGDPDGQYGLAKMYLTGEAKAPDDGAAGRLIRAAVAKDHPGATISLALAYTRKDPRFSAETVTPEAGVLLVKAAELGDVNAIETLSAAYRTGEYGLEADASQADRWAARLATIRGPKAGARDK